MKLAKILTLIIVISCYYLSAQNPNQQTLNYLKKELLIQQIPGLQIAVIKNNKLILSESFGLANVPFSVKTTNKTLFSINSIAKIFAATAIMQLVENSTLKLSDPVSKHLNNLPTTWHDITIEQLLSHTSGLPDIEHPTKDELIGGKGQDSAWVKVQKMPLEFNAGDAFSYNATNYLLIQKLVEKYNEMPYEETIKQKQFDIAKMTTTNFGNSFDVIANKSPTYCFYYLNETTGEYVKGDKLIETHETFPSILRADAGIFSNAKELAKWLIALRTGKLLKYKKHVNAMWKPIKLNNGNYDGFGDILNAYALGWPIIYRDKYPAVAAFGGGRAAITIYPKEDLAIVLLTNLSAGLLPIEIAETVSGFYLKK